MTGPLAGLRVVDCSRGTAGPRLTRMLADYGADVVWVEPPGGHPSRDQLAVDYAVNLRNKRSVTLDLHSAAGVELLLELVSRADVFIENWRPGVAERMGLGEAAIRARAPHVVSCSITGFGAEGQFRDVPGHEALVHALVGTMAEQPGFRAAPIFEGMPFASAGAAYLGAVGVLAALYRRNIDGVGRHVETSLYDGALAYLMMLWGDTDSGQAMHVPGANRLIARTFLCADEEYIGVHTGAVGAFGRLMKVLGLTDRIPAGETAQEMGVPLTPEQAQIVAEQIPALFLQRPRSEWLAILREADICGVEYLRPCQSFDQPQVLHNGMVVELDDPVLGRVQQVAPPIRFAASPHRLPTAAPRVGEGSGEGGLLLPDWTAVERVAPAGPPDVAPLAGVRILDLGAYYAGPYAPRLMADLGADVVKLEPLGGDPLRGLAVVFRSAQAGKRSIVADLKADDLAGARRHLVARADVIHHNMRPGAAERLGLGYEQAAGLNPDVVYVYAPGWGSSGPDRLRQSFAPNLSGFVGACFEVSGRFNPPMYPTGNEDPGGGLVGALAILMGLLHRQETGRGQYVESSQLNATLDGISHIVRRVDGEVLGADRLDPLQVGFSALERLYPTADGWICLAAQMPRDAESLGRALGPRLPARWVGSDLLDVDSDDLADALGAIFETRSSDEWLAELSAASVPAAAPKMERQAATFLRDPENRRTRRAAEVDHPRDIKVRGIDQLLRMSSTRVPPYRLAPELGEHTTEILLEAGYSPESIIALREQRLVR
ncbi:MAG: CoA transferase [Actinomycetota bacterium]|nr:CoA transferase [Actinomycetota bacterium]